MTGDDQRLVTVDVDAGVTTITINRPEARNAVDREVAKGLVGAFEKFDADPEQMVAILHGAGGVFSSGADLKAIGTDRANRVHRHGAGPMGPTRMRLSKPTIAAISGYAVAGGLELALWCDMRVADLTAIFGVFSRRWGVPLIDGGTVRLPRLIGQSRAMDMILTGRPIGADEALSFGLINRLETDRTALAGAVELARQLSDFPQTCMREDRLSLLEQQGLGEDAAMTNEHIHGLISLAADSGNGAVRFQRGEGRHGAF